MSQFNTLQLKHAMLTNALYGSTGNKKQDEAQLKVASEMFDILTANIDAKSLTRTFADKVMLNSTVGARCTPYHVHTAFPSNSHEAHPKLTIRPAKIRLTKETFQSNSLCGLRPFNQMVSPSRLSMTVGSPLPENTDTGTRGLESLLADARAKPTSTEGQIFSPVLKQRAFQHIEIMPMTNLFTKGDFKIAILETTDEVYLCSMIFSGGSSLIGKYSDFKTVAKELNLKPEWMAELIHSRLCPVTVDELKRYFREGETFTKEAFLFLMKTTRVK